MATKKIQIGFRATETTRKLIETEALKRDLSVQDFITCAVEYYSKTPSDWDYSASAFVKNRGITDEQIKEQQGWMSLWLKFMDRMPRAKVLLVVETIKLDLRHYKSSRRKVTRDRKTSGSVA
jgi:hypothetical protein